MNRIITNNYESAKPEIGMGVTQICWSDRHPYTIVEIVSPKEIVVQSDRSSRIDDRGMSDMQDYEYTPNPNAPRITLYNRYKDGHWRERAGGTIYMLGRREEYYDYSR